MTQSEFKAIKVPAIISTTTTSSVIFFYLERVGKRYRRESINKIALKTFKEFKSGRPIAFGADSSGTITFFLRFCKAVAFVVLLIFHLYTLPTLSRCLAFFGLS